jgi:hypothetical protein
MGPLPIGRLRARQGRGRRLGPTKPRNAAAPLPAAMVDRGNGPLFRRSATRTGRRVLNAHAASLVLARSKGDLP